MKGICHIWSRGRLISPSMPVGDDWYLNLNSQKRPPGRNLGEHRLVRRSGATSRGTVVLVFCLRMRSFPRTEVPTIFTGRSVCVGSRLLLEWILQNMVRHFVTHNRYKHMNDTLLKQRIIAGQPR